MLINNNGLLTSFLILFLLVLIAYKFKPSIWGFTILVVVFFVSYISPSFVKDAITNLFGDTNYSFTDKMLGYANSTSEGSTYKLFGVLFVFYIVSFCFKDALIKRNQMNGFFINMALIGCCAQAFAVGIPEFFRVAYYFTVFNMLLIPNICELLQEKYTRVPIRLITVCMLIGVYFLTGGFRYWFMWESRPW